MADLNDLYRILYLLYRADQISRKVTIQELIHFFPFMNSAGCLVPALNYLRKNGYAEGPDLNLGLTGKGLQTTVTFFRKFRTYLKAHRNDELATWINSLDLNRNNIHALIRDAYDYIQKQPPVTHAFNDYIDEVESIENVISYEVHEVNLSDLIDDIFMNIYDVNMLFEKCLKHKLFCQSPAAQPHLNKATRTRIDLNSVITTIASVIDSICYEEIDALLGSHRKINGSINKLQKLLEINGICYDANTIKRLRTLHALRSKTFPVHDGGPDAIELWRQLQIQYPIVDERRAVVKLLQALNSSLKEIKDWFT